MKEKIAFLVSGKMIVEIIKKYLDSIYDKKVIKTGKSKRKRGKLRVVN